MIKSLPFKSGKRITFAPNQGPGTLAVKRIRVFLILGTLFAAETPW